ncbi:MAG: glutathione S-transferase N-terminal domain-containing protein, partial [Polyangiaceae bacterium]
MIYSSWVVNQTWAERRATSLRVGLCCRSTSITVAVVGWLPPAPARAPRDALRGAVCAQGAPPSSRTCLESAPNQPRPAVGRSGRGRDSLRAMKIYGHPASTCTRKVLMTLNETNTPYELLLVDFAKGEHKQPAHLAHQPFGQVPALDDEGFEMYESRAMSRY